MEWLGKGWDEWDKMENAGAVFLPLTGSRLGTNVTGVTSEGDYWSVTANSNLNCKALKFTSTSVGMANVGRQKGCSVRLVKNY